MNTYYLNLLPAQDRRRQFLWERLRLWIAVWLATTAILVFVGWSKWASTHMARSQVELHRREFALLQQLHRDIVHVKAEIAQLQQREALTLSLSDERSMLQLLGLLSDTVSQCAGRASIREMSVSPDESGHQLELNGIALSHQGVAEFATHLRETKAFLEVKVKSSVPNRMNLVEARSFRLVCRF